MPLGAGGPLRFPSVRLQPLGHLSVFRINTFRAVSIRLSHTSAVLPSADAITFGFSKLKRTDDRLERNCVRPRNVVRALTATLGCGPPEYALRSQARSPSPAAASARPSTRKAVPSIRQLSSESAFTQSVRSTCRPCGSHCAAGERSTTGTFARIRSQSSSASRRRATIGPGRTR